MEQIDSPVKTGGKNDEWVYRYRYQVRRDGKQEVSLETTAVAQHDGNSTEKGRPHTSLVVRRIDVENVGEGKIFGGCLTCR